MAGMAEGAEESFLCGCARDIYIYIYTYIYIYIYMCVCVISTAADGTAAVLTKNLWAVTSHQTSHSNDLV